MNKVNTDKCEVYNCKENVEHILIKCRKFREEREKLKQCIIKVGREWDIGGVLGIENDQTEVTRAIIFFFARKWFN